MKLDSPSIQTLLTTPSLPDEAAGKQDYNILFGSNAKSYEDKHDCRRILHVLKLYKRLFQKHDNKI